MPPASLVRSLLWYSGAGVRWDGRLAVSGGRGTLTSDCAVDLLVHERRFSRCEVTYFQNIGLNAIAAAATGVVRSL